jgi:prevent-host-death family protein
MSSVDITRFQENISKLMEVAMSGAEIVITKNETPVLKLTAVSPQKKINRHPGSAKGLVWISDDFDQHLDDFKDYM